MRAVGPSILLCLVAEAAGFASVSPPAPPATDHYLEATKDTVRWGYYDLDAAPLLTMKSGETITIEVISHHSGHDYAKMIRGDAAVEEVFKWYEGETLEEKSVPKLAQSGVHIITGPVEVEGAQPGDILQVDILELDPRPNPSMGGRTFGTNSAKFAGYQFRVGRANGEAYTRAGGDEAITVFEFVKTPGGKMAWGKPLYMYTYPTIEDPAGDVRTIDNMPGVVIPHEYNMGIEPLEPVTYPPGFDAVKVLDDGNGNNGSITYLDVDLDWKVPLRPHLGILAVMPANSDNYKNGRPGNIGGANTIPPSKFGGNIDDWRIGKGATMYYQVEVDGAMLVAGDTHAAQGDSELAGTAMETSMTAQLKVTLHKKGSLPQLVANLDFPLLETSDSFVVHGFAYADYLDQLETPADIFAEGASVDLALEDCFNKTRSFLMDVFDVSEEESIVIMSTSVDFAITQIVDGNWGVHSTIPKWVFEAEDALTPYDYKCTPNPDGRRKRKLSDLGLPADVASRLATRITHLHDNQPALHQLGVKLVDAKLFAADKYLTPGLVPKRIKAALEAKGTLVPTAQALEAKLEGAIDAAAFAN